MRMINSNATSFLWGMDVAEECFFGTGCSSCVRCTGQGNDFELIPMVRIESQHSVEGPIGHEFSSMHIVRERFRQRSEVGSCL